MVVLLFGGVQLDGFNRADGSRYCPASSVYDAGDDPVLCQTGIFEEISLKLLRCFYLG